MVPLVQILIPSESRPLQECYFRGYVEYLQNKTLVYFTQFSSQEVLIKQGKECVNDFIIGYCGKMRNFETKKTTKKHTNFVLLNQTSDLKVIELTLNGKKLDIKKCVIILYDYEKIANTEVKWEFDDIFSKLQELVHNEKNQTNIEVSTRPLLTCPTWLKSSTFIQHIVNYANMFKWALTTIGKKRKITIKHGNFLMSILVDLFLGYFVLQFLTRDIKELSSMLMGVLEKLINMLYSLLKWLMGAPAGLKLNNAFNKMLGKYFSYHVQLWWLFLDVSGDKLDVTLQLYYYLGYLGLTFQAALISDMISVATFHSYCIYVYAARMFNIQISGLIALMRFFVGRKYNPLRGSIDSCEYTNQELFVGTVAFTILLLLLPTTAMYYIVFTLFRMLSLLVQYALAKIIYLLHTLPLYVMGLWLLRSPKVAGNVLMEVIDSKEESPLLIRLKVFNKSIFYLVNNFRPPIDEPQQLQWSNVLSNVLIGKQIM